MPSAAAPASSRVAVILLIHGDYARRYLAACYASLARQTYPASALRIFLVSNGTMAEDRALVRRVAPNVCLLENRDNLGWSSGNNRAVREALRQRYDYLVMLNVDTTVEPDWLARLVEAADARPDLHILQSTVLLGGGERLQTAGNRIHYLGYGYCTGYGRSRTAPPQPVPIDFASGAAMLVKRQVFEAVGFFRDEYFLYYDDLEFCWRARLAGFNVGVAAASVCRHHYDFQDRLRLLFYFQRNRLLTLLTLERLGTILVTLPCLLFSELIVGGYFVARGRGADVWALVRHFLRRRTWAAIAARRGEIRRLRTRTDAEIVGRFAGRVVFPELDGPAMRYLLNPLLACYWAVARRLILW